MRLRDIPECDRIVASHLTLAPSYDTEIANFCAVWRRFFANEWYFTSALFEEVEGARVKVFGAGLAATTPHLAQAAATAIRRSWHSRKSKIVITPLFFASIKSEHFEIALRARWDFRARCCHS
jgi:hypothetical protein